MSGKVTQQFFCNAYEVNLLIDSSHLCRHNSFVNGVENNYPKIQKNISAFHNIQSD